MRFLPRHRILFWQLYSSIAADPSTETPKAQALACWKPSCSTQRWSITRRYDPTSEVLSCAIALFKCGDSLCGNAHAVEFPVIAELVIPGGLSVSTGYVIGARGTD